MATKNTKNTKNTKVMTPEIESPWPLAASSCFVFFVPFVAHFLSAPLRWNP
jgi:hypothetical protein